MSLLEAHCQFRPQRPLPGCSTASLDRGLEMKPDPWSQVSLNAVV